MDGSRLLWIRQANFGLAALADPHLPPAEPETAIPGDGRWRVTSRLWEIGDIVDVLEAWETSASAAA